MSSFQDPPGRRTVPRHFVRCAISDAGGLRRPGTRSLDRPIRPERARMSCPCPDQSSCSARIHTPSQQNAAPSKPERAMGPPNACSAGLYVEGIRRLCRAPPAVAVPGRRGTGNADGVGRPQGATLARRDGWTAPSTPRQHQQQQRPTIRAGSPRTQSGSGVSDLRCFDSNRPSSAEVEFRIPITPDGGRSLLPCVPSPCHPYWIRAVPGGHPRSLTSL
jgi:hypothetical protein